MIRGRARELLQAFLESLLSGRYAEAERQLSALAKRLAKKGEWGEGYLSALRGLLDARRANDRHAFRLELVEDPEELKEFRKEFMAHAKARHHADFDRGYFSALKDLAFLALKRVRAQAQEPQTV